MINKNKNMIHITSEYSEQVSAIIQDKVSEVLRTTLDQLSEEYKRDITASISVDVK